MYGDGGTHIITKNAAANSSVTGSAVSGTTVINRILASTDVSSYTIENNFAFKYMSESASFADYPELKGEDKEETALKTKNTYSNDVSSGGLGWKFGSDDPWRWGVFNGYNYPTLYFTGRPPQ
jgi:hypothetical protein